MYKFVLFLLIICLVPYSTYGSTNIVSGHPQRQTYSLWNDVLDGGGTEATSSSYNLRGSAGQSTIGTISNSIYTAYIGYWGPIAHGGPPGVEEKPPLEASYPIKFCLFQNYPNPAFSYTTIKYGLPKTTNVILRVYNVAGQVVRNLINETQKTGYYTIRWDGRDSKGTKLASGIYFYSIKAGAFKSVRKVAIIR